jgi:hypothetical protein
MFVVISTFVFAGPQRVAALGGNAGYWADDYSNIANYPADVNNHSGSAWTSVNANGSSGFTSVFDHDGATWMCKASSVNNNVLDVGWGNGEMGVTLGVVMADGQDTDLTIGVGMPLAGGNFGFTTDTKDHSLNLSKAQDLWIWNNMLVGLDINEDDGNDATSTMDFNADFYSNNGTLLHAVGFAYGNGGDGSLTMTTTFGVESAWTDWATVRLGYSHGYDLMNQAGAAGDDALALGLGFNYGSFNLDMGISSDVLMDPVKYMTGNNTGTGDAALTTGVDITYTW